MEKCSRSQDEALVRSCLNGSEAAWQEFYSRFIGLMRSVVKKRYILCKEDVEDVTQSAFVSLATALKNFDYEQSLPRFVCVVTERVAIDQYRKRRAARRNSEDETTHGTEGGRDVALQIESGFDLPDEQMERAEMASRLGAALKELDTSCRELLTLRYLNDLSYKEISEMVGASENTLTVQTRRCLEKLRTKFREAERKGSRRCQK
jgi:RNA polymerase sigma-70 factor, ECF subfamily